jgi:hypothetical protein
MSTAAIPVHVALVDLGGSIDAADLATVAGALNEQVQADLAPAWHVAATVGYYPAVPAHTWRIELQHGIDAKDAAGYHSDENHQPFSRVDLDAGNWTVTTSHELVEMLCDPWGSRMHTAAALPGWRGSSPRVTYLLEPCDPCERVAYPVGGVELSDFVLPGFYRSSRRGSVSGYSHTGALTEPLEILPEGYISFMDPADNRWWQRFVDRDGNVDDVELPEPDGSEGSLREWLDRHAREHRADDERS